MSRLLIAAAVVALAPGFALAAGCDHDRQATMTCAPGSTFDQASGTCVPDATG